MLIVCLDLEGVLVPEVWINVAEKTGIEELRLTTRDISDYDELMKHRLKVMEKHSLSLTQIQEVIDTLSPFEGAVEFLDWVRSKVQLVILSDTFVEFAAPLMKKLKMPTLFCHSLTVDEKDRIVDYNLRLADHKKKSVQAFRGLNFKTLAAGDSFNDLSMLKEADQGIFFRPPQSISEQFPEIPVTQSYEELKKHIIEFLKQG